MPWAQPAGLIRRGIVRRDLGYAKGALEDFDKAISLSPNHAAAYSGRGELYLRQQNYTAAVADFDRAIKLARQAGSGRRFTGADHCGYAPAGAEAS